MRGPLVVNRHQYTQQLDAKDADATAFAGRPPPQLTPQDRQTRQQRQWHQYRNNPNLNSNGHIDNVQHRTRGALRYNRVHGSHPTASIEKVQDDILSALDAVLKTSLTWLQRMSIRSLDLTLLIAHSENIQKTNR